MKKTVLDGKQWILEILLDANLKISDKIYKDKRPTESQKEDIVINSLTMTNEFLQKGVFNVNCYVPMLSIKNTNGIIQKQKNAKRLKEITNAVYSALDEVWNDDYLLKVTNHQEFEEDNFNYINFRVDLKVI